MTITVRGIDVQSNLNNAMSPNFLNLPPLWLSIAQLALFPGWADRANPRQGQTRRAQPAHHRHQVGITNLGRLASRVAAGPAPRAAQIGHPPMDTPDVRRIALGFDARVRADLAANCRAAGPA